ncbi:MAG: YdeI/OmpD-associated family protein [Actinomycetota bacterium]|nr:YdeI/OmpD-associated family protein [Actinomycetota bacterium]
MARKRFSARLEEDERGACSFVVPDEIVGSLGAGKRPPVNTTINGYPYRTRVAVYDGVSYVALRKDIQAGASLGPGDRVTVTIELDESPREIDVPPDLARALNGDRAAQAAFDKLSFTHRKEYTQWITDAKREETRRRRVGRAVEMLRGGVKTP